MRTLFILLMLAFGGYKAWDYFANVPVAAYDEAGNPLTLVFTFNNCTPCDNAVKLLAARHIDFTEYNVSTDPEAQKLMKSLGGGRILPYIVTGNRTLAGFEQDIVVGMLAEVYGTEILTARESRALRQNFDAAGLPRVVMYSTERCGYCKQARAYIENKGFDVTERDIDRDASAKRDFDTLHGGGTPLTYVGFRRVHGINWKLMDDALEVL